MPFIVANRLPHDAGGDSFWGPWDVVSDTGLALRGANVSGDYADARVVLYDASGNALIFDTGKARVSLYGKGNGTAGDTAVLLDSAGRVLVNPISGQTGVAAGAGAVGVTTQRITLASDDPALTVIGSTADAAVAAGAPGTLSAKLRAISRDLVANIVLAAGTALIGKVGLAGKASVTGDTEIDATTADADGVSNSVNSLRVTARISGYNGSTWDRIRAGMLQGAANTGMLSVANHILGTGSLAQVQKTAKLLASGNDGDGLPGQALFAWSPADNNWHPVNGVNANADGVDAAAFGAASAGFGYVFNGTTWDRQKSVAFGAGVVGSSTQRMTLASDDPAVIAFGAITEPPPYDDTVAAGVNGRLQRISATLVDIAGLLGVGVATWQLESVSTGQLGTTTRLAYSAYIA